MAEAVKVTRAVANVGTKRIVLGGGEHAVNAPIVLEPEDSGLTIEGDPKSPALLSGGRRIRGWKPDGDRFWSAQLPELNGKPWEFRMLTVNGRFCRRARLPKEGAFEHLSRFAVIWRGSSLNGWARNPTPQELTTLCYRPQDLGPWLDIKNAEVTVYHMWDESTVGIASMDLAKHTLTLASPCGHPPGAFDVFKYAVHNVRQGMTEPGQWYLDRTAGKVVYWPLVGEDMARADVMAPTVESIIQIKGRRDAPVRNVTLRDFKLSVTNTPLAAGGFGAIRFEGAISARMVKDCRFERLTIDNVAGQGISAKDVTGLQVCDCVVSQTGACGIIAYGSDIRISGNLVHHVGRIYPSAIGVWTKGGEQAGNRVVRNEIHDTSYTALACSGNNHRLKQNLIYRAMQDLHDGAGIYITFCKGVVVQGNLVRDIVDTGGYGASAYYLDEQAEQCLVEDNLSFQVVRALQVHMASKNTIRNNVFVNPGDVCIKFPKSANCVFERNVVQAGGNITLTGAAALASSRDNVLYSTGGAARQSRDVINYYPKALEPMGPAGGWTLADPRLTGIEQGQVRFGAESPLPRLGIHAINPGRNVPPTKADAVPAGRGL